MNHLSNRVGLSRQIGDLPALMLLKPQPPAEVC